MADQNLNMLTEEERKKLIGLLATSSNLGLIDGQLAFSGFGKKQPQITPGTETATTGMRG